MSRRKNSYLGTGIFIVVLVGVLWLLLYLGGSRGGAANADALALCLRDKKITMYGAYWCPHCQNVKREFGSSFQYVLYVECTADANACDAAGVKGYPTWIFPDGRRIEGETTLDELARQAGCPGPAAAGPTPSAASGSSAGETSPGPASFSPVPASSTP